MLSAQRNLEVSNFGPAASDAYFAAFHSASALLLTEGVERAHHSGIKAEYDQRVAHGRLIGKEFHKGYDTLFNLRNQADYSRNPVKVKDAKEAYEWATRMLAATKAYCDDWFGR